MGDNVKIIIKEVKGKEVRCSYIIADWQHTELPNLDDTYALQIITELYNILRKNYEYKDQDYSKYPLSKEEAQHLIETHPAKDLLEECSSLIHAFNPPLYEESRKFIKIASDVIDKNNNSYRIENLKNHHFTYEFSSPDADWRTPPTIYPPDVEIYNEATPPECDFYFTVKDEKILYHVKPGFMWHSAMFGYVNYLANMGVDPF